MSILLFILFCFLISGFFSAFSDEHSCYIPNTKGTFHIVPERKISIDFGNIPAQEISNNDVSVIDSWKFAYTETHIPIPETDILIDMLSEKIFWPEKKGTMTLQRELLWPAYENPLYKKVYILGSYDRWWISYAIGKRLNEYDSRKEILSLQLMPKILWNPYNIPGTEPICEFYDTNPLYYNVESSQTHHIHISETESYRINIYPFVHENIKPEEIYTLPRNAFLIADPILDIGGWQLKIFDEKWNEVIQSFQSQWTRKYQAQHFSENIGIFPYYEVDLWVLSVGKYQVEFTYGHFAPHDPMRLLRWE